MKPKKKINGLAVVSTFFMVMALGYMITRFDAFAMTLIITSVAFKIADELTREPGK